MTRSKDHRLLAQGALLAALAAACGVVGKASAQATNVETRGVASPREVEEASEGPKFGLTAGVFFRSPKPDDRVGFSAAADFYYNFRLGSLVLAPGGRFSAYIARDFLAIGALGTGRAGLMLGAVLPYVIGGLGVGFIGIEHNDTGMAYLGGGGVLVNLRRRVGLGVEASYQGFVTSPFRAAYLGATMQFSY